MTGERQITEKERRQYERSDTSQGRIKYTSKSPRQNRFDMQDFSKLSKSEVRPKRTSKSIEHGPEAVEK